MTRFLTISLSLIIFSCNRASDGKGNDIQRTVVIGSQEWTAKNLNVSSFRNGDPVFEANSYEDWEKACIEGNPAWCYYEHDPENSEKYGKLYNWWAVSDSRGLAPEGWHVPDKDEWETLSDYLGGMELAGKKMKSFTGWQEPCNGNDESGFSGLPGGYRSHEGPGLSWEPFYKKDSGGYWWSTTRYLVDNVWSYKLSCQDDSLGKDSFVRTAGLSVRLIKD